MKKSFIAAALGLSFVTAHGMTDQVQAKEDAPAYTTGTRIRLGNLTLPRCRTENGRTATYVISTSPELFTPFTYSITRNGQPGPVTTGIPQARGHYIVLPQKFIARASRDTTLFAVAHECAHQELGHTVELNNGYDQAMVQNFEREADCLAPAILMQDYGFTAERTAQIITNAFTSRVMRRHDHLMDESTATHDKSDQRLANTMACLRSQLAGPQQ